MSHFMLVVLVPKETAPQLIESKVSNLLASYDENLAVPEYEANCYCCGYAARERARAAIEIAQPIEALRARVELVCAERGVAVPEAFESSDEVDAIWAQLLEPRNAAERALLEADPEFEKPDATCDECGGSGKRKVTYNPQSKWDWWVIGGRYDGRVQGIEVESADGGFNFGYEHHQLANNVIETNLLKKGIHKDITRTPFAVLTPDGEWHERGEMGWCAVVKDEKRRSTWQEEVLELLDKNENTWAVGVDCHI